MNERDKTLGRDNSEAPPSSGAQDIPDNRLRSLRFEENHETVGNREPQATGQAPTIGDISEGD